MIRGLLKIIISTSVEIKVEVLIITGESLACDFADELYIERLYLF